MTDKPTRAWFQFDLKTLFVLTAIVAAWMAWQYRPQPKPKSALADTLKVGDGVVLRERAGMYTLIVPSGSQRTPYTVDFMDAEVVRLKSSTQTTAIRIERIARVDRYDPPKPPSATAANGAGPAASGEDDLILGGNFQPRPSAPGDTDSCDPFGPDDPDVAPPGSFNETQDEPDPVPPPPTVNENGS